VAEDSDTVRALVDAIQCSSEAAACREQVWSVRGEPAGLRRALEAYGLRGAPYLYLQGRIDGAGPATALIPGSRLLASSDIPRLGALFACAYEGSDAVRAFAPDGSANGWEAYLRTLLESDGCGTMLPYASLVLETAGVLQGAVICSSIDREARVTHLGQIAVHPGARGRGAGRTLLESAITRCAAAGSKEMTLLVAEANLPARRLYESLGFTEVARFTVAATS
jgi:ribosomal protein S18 acetylase RimI-like enzyme